MLLLWETETKDPLVLRAYQLKQEFFTPEILTEICSRLVTHYFLLTPMDLETWDTHPESFGKHRFIFDKYNATFLLVNSD